MALLTGIIYGIEPYGGHTMGWASPPMRLALVGGVLIPVLFVWVKTKVKEPMFDVQLFRIRAFASGALASLMASLGGGGLIFILVI